jgi:hypothetical protein
VATTVLALLVATLHFAKAAIKCFHHYTKFDLHWKNTTGFSQVKCAEGGQYIHGHGSHMMLNKKQKFLQGAIKAGLSMICMQRSKYSEANVLKAKFRSFINKYRKCPRSRASR